MNFEWKYFIVLCTEKCYGKFVEYVETTEDGLAVCDDVAVAKSFSSPEELLKWVGVNTNLKMEKADFKIEGQYLPS